MSRSSTMCDCWVNGEPDTDCESCKGYGMIPMGIELSTEEYNKAMEFADAQKKNELIKSLTNSHKEAANVLDKVQLRYIEQALIRRVMWNADYVTNPNVDVFIILETKY